MTPEKRTFLVTGARAPAALEIIRRLGRAGHSVLAADSVRLPVSRFSRYVRRYFRVPAPRTHPAGFIDALRRIVSAEGVNVLLPTCEEIYYVSRYRKELGAVCEIFCAEFDTLETLHHKARFARLTHELGGPVTAPESRPIEESEQLRALAPDSRAWVFKPVYSRFATRTLIRPSPVRLAQLTCDPTNPWLAQRFVAGRELSSYGIAVRGQLAAHTLYHSRHRSGQAAGIYFVPEGHTVIRDFAARIVAHLDFTGQIAFDFIVCAATGRVFVLECNPRLTSGIHLFAPGFDLDAALRGDAGLPSSNTTTQRPKMLAAAMLLDGFNRSLFTGNFSAWRRDFMAGDDVISAQDDPLPVFGQLAFLAEMGIRSLRQRIGLIAAMTADIEWNGAAHP